MRRITYQSASLTGLCILLLLTSCSGISPVPSNTSVPGSSYSGVSSADSTAGVMTAGETAEIPQDSKETKESSQTSAKETPARSQYSMDLTLDTGSHTIGGIETVIVYNDSEDTWNKLCFRDYPSLFAPGGGSGYDSNGAVSEISNVKDLTSGVDLEIARDEEDASIVYMDLSIPIKPGESRKIELDFTAYVPKLKSRYGYQDDVFNLANFYPVLAVYENGIWSTEPYFLWGECFYSKVSDYKATLSVPLGITVVSSGLSHIDTISAGRAVWKISAEKVRDFAVVAGSGFAVTSTQADGVTINCYYRDGNIEWAAAALEAGAAAAVIFDGTFGEYPYPELDIVETYLDAGGMEYPNIVMISNTINSYSEKSSYLRIVVAHEVAHQWFYGLVGDNQYTEPWLDESFASYSELVYKETFTDEQAINQEVDSLEDSLIPEGIPDSAEDFYINRPYNEFENNNAYTYTVYMRGEVFLFRIREAMGTDAFNMAMKEYVAEYSFKIARTDDFEAVITKYAGDNPEVTALLAKYLRQE
ncbi:MAG: M1 family metallopeptidase [Eubacteriales bacterium]